MTRLDLSLRAARATINHIAGRFRLPERFSFGSPLFDVEVGIHETLNLPVEALHIEAFRGGSPAAEVVQVRTAVRRCHRLGQRKLSKMPDLQLGKYTALSRYDTAEIPGHEPAIQ